MFQACNSLSRWQTVFQQNTVLELIVVTLPTSSGLALGRLIFSVPMTLFSWFVTGMFVLIIVVASGRTSTIDYSLVKWPRPETVGDLIINGIAYDSVLVLGVGLAQMVWIASDNVLLSGGIAAILPIWFLKHIRLLVFLGE